MVDEEIVKLRRTLSRECISVVQARTFGASRIGGARTVAPSIFEWGGVGQVEGGVRDQEGACLDMLSIAFDVVGQDEDGQLTR